MTWLFIVILLSFIYHVWGEEADLAPRIINGFVVTDRSLFAYQVSIRIRRANRHYCGGAIIDQQHVLTAAHCCVNSNGDTVAAKAIEIYAGDLNLNQPLKSTQIRRVKYIFAHENFDGVTAANDIALLRVDTDFTINEYVHCLKLPSKAPPTGKTCIISGWGITDTRDPLKTSENLRFVSVPILEEYKCTLAYGKRIKPGMFCAGYLDGKADSCQGDSGGALACNKTLVGIISWGWGCAWLFLPGVYTDVFYYLQWIKNKQQASSSSINIGSICIIITTALIVMIVKYIVSAK